jgi:branched-chain amino acid transport system ATP-binding protein
MTAVLDIKNLTMDFGGLRALDDVDIAIEQGLIVALIGPNGAGKTTVFNCITGIYDPTGGDVLMRTSDGGQKRINGMKPNKITELGMARTFQNIRLFPSMTTLENVIVGCHPRMKAGIWGAAMHSRFQRNEEQEVVEKSYILLEKVGLAKWAMEKATNLPYGQQRRLEIARAMATEPSLLLLDEPAAGMNPYETSALKDLVIRIREEEGKTVFLIEHDMKMVMTLSDHVVVMEYGKKLAEGTPQEVSENPEVIKAYLGEEHDA